MAPFNDCTRLRKVAKMGSAIYGSGDWIAMRKIIGYQMHAHISSYFYKGISLGDARGGKDLKYCGWPDIHWNNHCKVQCRRRTHLLVQTVLKVLTNVTHIQMPLVKGEHTASAESSQKS
jgi:hypothetical protein